MEGALSAACLEVVAVVRPLRDEEQDAGSVFTVSNSRICVEAPVGSTESGGASLEESFSFDRCAEGDAVDRNGTAQPSTATARLVEDLAARFANDALSSGIDSTLIAYGQRDTGKSHTVVGSTTAGSTPGLLPQIARHLLGPRARETPGLSLSLSALEISPAEELRDLLSTHSLPAGAASAANGATGSRSQAPTPTVLNIVEHPALGSFVAGLSEVACTSVQGVQELLRHCLRESAATSTSLGSSAQAHTLYTLHLKRSGGGSSPSKVRNGTAAAPLPAARIVLADLAGSESAPAIGGGAVALWDVESSRQALGAMPRNQGLCAFHAAVRAMSEGKIQSIGFGSKLMQILGGALAGSSQTTFLATLSPAWPDLEESRRTLRLAAVVGRLAASAERRAAARLRERPTVEQVSAMLQEQVQRLRSQLTLDSRWSKALVVPLASWQWLLENHAAPGRPTNTHLRELEAVHRRRGFLTSSSASQVGGAPYLSNLSNDVQLRGTLICPLRQPPAATGLITIGSHRDCSFFLAGVGVPQRLCDISVAAGDEVSLRLLPPFSRQQPCRCTINGGLVRRGVEAKLEHGDRLIFGWAHVFQLVAPERAERLGLALSPPLMTEEDAVSELNPDDSDTYAELSLYIEDIRDKMGNDMSGKFLDLLKEACFFVDEANEITRDMRPELELKYDIDFVWDIFQRVQDVIVVRVIHRTGSDSESMVLSYWTYPKFCERLAAMRSVYHCYVHKGHWDGAGQLFEDPWRDAAVVDLRQQLSVEKASLDARTTGVAIALEAREARALEEARAMREAKAQEEARASEATRALEAIKALEAARNSEVPQPLERSGSQSTAATLAPADSPPESARSTSPTPRNPVDPRVPAASPPPKERTSLRAPPGRAKARADRRRQGDGPTFPSKRSSVAAGADGAGGPAPAENGERPERSPSPSEAHRRRMSNVEANSEMERLRRDSQRQLAEIRRLKAERQQDERERRLQDELVESLRSQLKDKDELVTTLRSLLQNRTGVKVLQNLESPIKSDGPGNSRVGSPQTGSDEATTLPPSSHVPAASSRGESVVSQATVDPSIALASATTCPPPSPPAAGNISRWQGAHASVEKTWSVKVPLAANTKSGDENSKMSAVTCDGTSLLQKAETSGFLHGTSPPQSPRAPGSSITVLVQELSWRETGAVTGSQPVLVPSPPMPAPSPPMPGMPKLGGSCSWPAAPSRSSSPCQAQAISRQQNAGGSLRSPRLAGNVQPSSPRQSHTINVTPVLQSQGQRALPARVLGQQMAFAQISSSSIPPAVLKTNLEAPSPRSSAMATPVLSSRATVTRPSV